MLFPGQLWSLWVSVCLLGCTLDTGKLENHSNQLFPPAWQPTSQSCRRVLKDFFPSSQSKGGNGKRNISLIQLLQITVSKSCTNIWIPRNGANHMFTCGLPKAKVHSQQIGLELEKNWKKVKREKWGTWEKTGMNNQRRQRDGEGEKERRRKMKGQLEEGSDNKHQRRSIERKIENSWREFASQAVGLREPNNAEVKTIFCPWCCYSECQEMPTAPPFVGTSWWAVCQKKTLPAGTTDLSPAWAIHYNQLRAPQTQLWAVAKALFLLKVLTLSKMAGSDHRKKINRILKGENAAFP